jgi:hypothetical protein
MSNVRRDQQDALQQLGDDKGEGTQRDIPTDRIETSHDSDPAALPGQEDRIGTPAAPAQPERQQGDRDLGSDSKSTIDNQGLQ